jgi:oxygen-dependent protoporphyrinogen oxidase
VFYALRTGIGRLVTRLEESLTRGGATLRNGVGITRLEREADSWVLSTVDGTNVSARAVVLATPGFVTADLLRPHSQRLAAALDGIEYASVVIVTLVFDDGAASFPEGSGFLVPRVDGRLLSAGTWFSAKWPHVRPNGGVVVRLSAGKVGNDRAMHLDDETLVHKLRAELAEATGVDAEPAAIRINRWPRSFPQYDVGHVALVDRMEHEADALRGIGLAGAAYRGVGIPACIGSAERAVGRLLNQ